MSLAAFLPLLCLSLAAPVRAETRHTVVPKDTMWDLADRYYKDNFKWRRISGANPPPTVKDPHWIYPGQVLVIPDGEESPAAAEALAAESAPAEPPPSSEPVVYKPQRPPEDTMAAPMESLSTRFPEGLTGGGPSAVRLQAMPDWTPDGTVLDFQGREAMVAEGDTIRVRFAAGVELKPGRRFFVFRKGAPTEADPDKEGTYLVRVGLVEVRKKAEDGTVMCLILKSDDSIQLGDLLKKGD